MAEGAGGSGDDMVSGRVNRADGLTAIWAQVPPPGEVHYAGGAILKLEVAQDAADPDDYEDPGSFSPPNPFHGLVAVGHSGGGGGFPFGGTSGAAGVVACGGNNGGTGVVGVGGGSPLKKEFQPGSVGVGGIGVHGFGGSPDSSFFNPTPDPPGAGVIGQGGRQHESDNTLRLPHAAGVIGISGGTGRKQDGSQVDLLPIHTLAQTGGVGVYGQGADASVIMVPPRDEMGPLPGPEVASGPLAPGAGVVGRGGIAIPATGTDSPGPVAAGVIGLAGGVPIPSNIRSGNAGVYGAGATGVRGESNAGTGVSGVSISGRGGTFSSASAAQVQLVPRSIPRAFPTPVTVTPTALPTVREPVELPKMGQGGDLLALMDNQRRCTLWFCVAGGDSSPALWAQVLLGPPYAGTV